MSLEERSSPSEAPGDPPSRKSSISAERLAVQLLDEDDRVFLEGLRTARLLAELDAEELLRVASEVPEDASEDERRTTLLELYYDAAGDPAASTRRRRADRFFIQRVGDPATAAGLVERLVELTPELPTVALERIGGSDGPLVVRAGEHFAAVLDDYEEEAETDELERVELEQRASDVPMVTVRGLVRGLNVLLDRSGVRERLVSLRGDDAREVYVGLGVGEAMQLARAGYLEDDDVEELMELGAW